MYSKKFSISNMNTMNNDWFYKLKFKDRIYNRLLLNIL